MRIAQALLVSLSLSPALVFSLESEQGPRPQHKHAAALLIQNALK